jgi:hypothetical protein
VEVGSEVESEVWSLSRKLKWDVEVGCGSRESNWAVEIGRKVRKDIRIAVGRNLGIARV